MFDGYLDIDGIEIVNNERAIAYGAALGTLEFPRAAEYTGLWRALEHSSAYTTPSGDGAPWYRASDAATGEFRGVYCTSIEGGENSTQVTEMTELAGDGAVGSVPRFGARELRVKAVLLATTGRGMRAGTAWLRNTLEGGGCGKDANCADRTLGLFSENPSSTSSVDAQNRALEAGRFYPAIELLDGFRVLSEKTARSGLVREVEFILTATRPWRYTNPSVVATTTNVNPTTAAQVDCPSQTDIYDALVRDPNASLVRPPRPPAIEPLAMPNEWQRYQMNISSAWGEKHGRIVPVFYVVNDGSTARRMIRVRISRSDHSTSCDYEGEWLITYLPAGATLTLDGIREKITILHNGKETSGSHLVVGSGGRPRRWAAMNCGGAYRVYVDSDGPIGSVLVQTYLSLRE